MVYLVRSGKKSNKRNVAGVVDESMPGRDSAGVGKRREGTKLVPSLLLRAPRKPRNSAAHNAGSYIEAEPYDIPS